MTTATSAAKNAGGGVLVSLGLSMFVYVIDTTIMSVAMSDLVIDLNTDLAQVQLALTVYTLVMASFMVTGGKLGTIWGPLKAFRIGLIIYGIGTLMTAFSANIGMLLVGWSVLEGLGSALIVPAVNTLVRSNFEGDKRASAYGLLGGVAAAGAALGPIVGGWITTAYTWRLAFIIEAVIVAGVLLSSRKISDAVLEGPKPKLDYPSVVLSALGLGLAVYGILQTGTQGWGSPAVWALIIVGVVILVIFVRRSIKLEEGDGEPIVRMSLFKNAAIGAGTPVTVAQTFAQNGILYLVPVFAQLVLGLDALGTGLAVLPLSLGVMIFAIGTSKLGHRFYPRTIIQVGLLIIFAGGVLLAVAIPEATKGTDLLIAMFVMGTGIGVVSAQLPNLMLSGVEPDETSEAAGIGGTAQNFGMSLGTAVAGSVLLLILGAGFASGVADSEVLAEGDKAAIEQLLETNAETLGTEFEELLADRPTEETDEVLRIAKDSSDGAFQFTVLVLGLVALVGYLWAFKLPKQKLAGNTIEESARAATSMIAKVQLDI